MINNITVAIDSPRYEIVDGVKPTKSGMEEKLERNDIVTGLFNDLFSRPASSSEMTTWTDVILLEMNGKTTAEIQLEIKPRLISSYSQVFDPNGGFTELYQNQLQAYTSGQWSLAILESAIQNGVENISIGSINLDSDHIDVFTGIIKNEIACRAPVLPEGYTSSYSPTVMPDSNSIYDETITLIITNVDSTGNVHKTFKSFLETVYPNNAVADVNGRTLLVTSELDSGEDKDYATKINRRYCASNGSSVDEMVFDAYSEVLGRQYLFPDEIAYWSEQLTKNSWTEDELKIAISDGAMSCGADRPRATLLQWIEDNVDHFDGFDYSKIHRGFVPAGFELIEVVPEKMKVLINNDNGNEETYDVSYKVKHILSGQVSDSKTFEETVYYRETYDENSVEIMDANEQCKEKVYSEGDAFVHPRTDAEIELTGLYTEVLGRKYVSTTGMNYWLDKKDVLESINTSIADGSISKGDGDFRKALAIARGKLIPSAKYWETSNPNPKDMVGCVSTAANAVKWMNVNNAWMKDIVLTERISSVKDLDVENNVDSNDTKEWFSRLKDAFEITYSPAERKVVAAGETYDVNYTIKFHHSGMGSDGEIRGSFKEDAMTWDPFAAMEPVSDFTNSWYDRDIWHLDIDDEDAMEDTEHTQTVHYTLTYLPENISKVGTFEWVVAGSEDSETGHGTPLVASDTEPDKEEDKDMFAANPEWRFVDTSDMTDKDSNEYKVVQAYLLSSGREYPDANGFDYWLYDSGLVGNSLTDLALTMALSARTEGIPSLKRVADSYISANGWLVDETVSIGKLYKIVTYRKELTPYIPAKKDRVCTPTNTKYYYTSKVSVISSCSSCSTASGSLGALHSSTRGATIKWMYTNVLGRKYDQAGYDYWMKTNENWSKYDLFITFLNSRGSNYKEYLGKYYKSGNFNQLLIDERNNQAVPESEYTEMRAGADVCTTTIVKAAVEATYDDNAKGKLYRGGAYPQDVVPY